MTELAELYAVIVVIYLLECGEWFPHRGLGLVRVAGRWRARRPFRPNSSWQQGVFFGEPWPPLSAPLLVEPLPFVVSPDGISFEGRPEQGPDTPKALPWSSVRRVHREGTRLFIDGAPVASLGSRRAALHLADTLARLAPLGTAERLIQLERWLDGRWDATHIVPRLNLYQRSTRWVRLASNTLWVALFLGLPTVIWTPWSHLFLPLVALVLLTWIAGAVAFERALRGSDWLPRSLWPDLAKRIVVVSSPLGTLRALDHLGREVAGDLEPLAVAAPLVSSETLAALARPRLVALQYGSAMAEGSGGPTAAPDGLRWHRQQEATRLKRLLRTYGVHPEALLVAPSRQGPQVSHWCPCCCAQYDEGHPHGRGCPHETCEGVPLQAYPPTPVAPE